MAASLTTMQRRFAMEERALQHMLKQLAFILAFAVSNAG